MPPEVTATAMAVAAGSGEAAGALSPRLTALDERVLAALPCAPGLRAVEVARAVHGREGHWRGLGTPDGRRQARDRDVREVRRILRGFEHLGRARCRGGWWTAT